MNIRALEGHKVMVTKESAKNGHDHDGEAVRKHLTLRKHYTVKKTEVHNFHSYVWLKEVPGVSFNTVNFVDVEVQSEKKATAGKK